MGEPLKQEGEEGSPLATAAFPVPRPGTSEVCSIYLVTEKGLPLACTCWDRGQGRGQSKENAVRAGPEWPGYLSRLPPPDPGAGMCAPPNLYGISGHTGFCPSTPLRPCTPQRSTEFRRGGHQSAPPLPGGLLCPRSL